MIIKAQGGGAAEPDTLKSQIQQSHYS